MLECLSFKSMTLTPPPSSSITNLPPPPHSQGNSTEATTPATSTRSSPSANVSREYDLAVQANSCDNIRSIIQAPPQDQLHYFDVNGESDNENDSSHHRQVLAQVLQPDHESIREALHSHAPRSTLTRLVSNYFDHSESTCDLCLQLHRSVHRTRYIYTPLYDLIAVLPDDSGSLSKHHCGRAYDIFVEFDQHDNPFFFPHAPRNFANIRHSFSELKQQIEIRRSKSHSRIRLIRHATNGCVMCLIVTAVGVMVSTVFFTMQAVAGCAVITAAPFCSNRCIPHPKKSERKELVRLKQLDAAAKSTYVVNDLDTIDSLVDRLQAAVEGDKALVRFALERGRERHPIQEVLKQLRKNQQSLQHQLEDLEEHIFLFINTVNKARSSLLQEICLHQIL
ncbi:hypothetical protein TanjilG_08826 [Lupinus angustifolius]|uniref:Uncharacterized protein n=1 Tax=Lupinus angustifolius TaxID=3871 RepID=A0A394DA34_LUPAN|nr:PREDICTED: UPF0496 protein At3g19330-like [Lupinus angustifolius]OIW20322.1 hypothetical protein TanjilG_08826 [Lupinus angustifolius]